MELVSEGPTHRFAGVGNVLVTVYWGAPTPEALRERIPWIERTVQTHGRLGLLVVITADAQGGLPDRGFREESRAQAERFREPLAFSASVIEGRGVLHSLARTFLRGLSVMAGKGFEVRFFDTVREGAAFAADALAPDGPSADALAEAVEALRP